MPLLPFSATAHPETVTTFASGTSSVTVLLPFPPREQLAGTVEVLSNATVNSGYVRLSGETYSVPTAFTDNAASGFANGTLSAGVEVRASAVTGKLLNGSAEFTGGALDGGTYTGTVRPVDGVILQGTSGTYTSPDITWNGLSYGRLIAQVLPGFGTWGATFDIVDGGGSVLQASVLPGAVITVDGTLHGTIRVRATLTAPTPNDSPKLMLVGAGYVISDYLQSTAAARSLSNLKNYGGSVELIDSFYNWTEYASNPVFGPGGGSLWWAKGVLPSTSVIVGHAIWMYVSGIDASDVMHIGRMVSNDGGVSWTVDGTPVINSTAASWDSGYVGIPSVLYDGVTFKMWYMGAVTVDQFRIGYATSSDGVTWTKYASNPVLSQGPSVWDGYNVGWPKVINVSGTYYMFYGGRSTTDARKQIGYATSTDGLSWTKYASNPIVSWSSTSAGAYEAISSDVQYSGGVFYMYWTCSGSATAYDVCVSTSNNAQSWTHFSTNPIITHGDGTWDSLTAELASMVFDPATGHSKLIYTARPASTSYSVGRADPRRESAGTYLATWNLSAEVPHAFLTYDLLASTPAGTSLQSSLQVSTTGTVYQAPESLDTHDTLITSAPAAYLRETVNLSTSDTRFSPSVTGSRLAYDAYLPSGSFLSSAHATPYPIANATVTLSSSVPAGARLGLNVSNDGGATWRPATSGVLTAFPSPGASFRYRLDLNGTTAKSPTVTSVAVNLGVDSTPQGVRVRGPDGTSLAYVAGDLLAPVALTLDPAYFNGRLAPFAASDPPVLVDVDLYVNASTAGIVHLDALVLNLSVPDLLRVHFAPDPPSLFMEEGTAQNFRAVAATTPGVAITYAWTVDATASPETGDLLTFTAAVGSAGDHTVSLRVSNGQFTVDHTWNITVLPKPVYLAASFYPGVHAVEVPAGLLQQFFASAVSSVAAPAISWSLDGAPDGTGPVFNYTAAATAGLHVLDVAVTNGVDTLGWEWNITVTAAPQTPSHQITAAFAPSGDLTLDVGQMADFFANVTGGPLDTAYEWRLDGNVVGGGTPSYTFHATGANAGSHLLTVLAHNATALAAHAWTVTALGPAPPAPAVAITSPSAGLTTNASTITVEGTASAGATVFVAGVEANVTAGGQFTAQVPLVPGQNVIAAVARAPSGLTASAQVTVTYVPAAPPGPTPSTGGTLPTEAGISTPSLAIMLVLLAGLGVVTVLLLRERRRRSLAESSAADAPPAPAPAPPPPGPPKP